MYAIPLALSAFVAIASAHVPGGNGLTSPVWKPSQGGKAACVSGFVSVAASTNKNIKLYFDLPQNQTQTTEIFLKDITPGSPFASSIMGPQNTVSGTYDIGATLCTPIDNPDPKGVQLLTHGVGFDRSYWDFAPGYSYVDVAAEHGYASFFYDRLGVAKSASTKLNAIQEIQSPLEAEITNNIAGMLRNGTFGGCSFDKVVGVGHSFGSIITEGVTSQYPKTFDAAILTGFSIASSGFPPFFTGLNLALANQNQPLRFSAMNNGYVVSDTAISNQIGFFKFPGFDPAILAAAEDAKQTVTFGELFTTMAIIANATQYWNPVAVVDGEEDLPFCFGNCSYPSNLAANVHQLYSQVPDSKFDTYLAPDTGHGLNLHYSATAAYEYIQSFLAKQGLGMA